MERGKRALFPNYRESEGRGLDPDAVVNSLTDIVERVSPNVTENARAKTQRRQENQDHIAAG